jgi:uncharacterized membrane protein YhaH (DUF805 family)
MSFWQMMFSFEGRLRRRDYWLCSLALTAATMVLAILLYTVVAASGSADVTNDGVTSILQLVLTALGLWPSLAIGVKRCHDRNQSGAMVAIQFIPVVGLFWALINLGILDGTPGPNKYGPSPKGLQGAGTNTADVFS